LVFAKLIKITFNKTKALTMQNKIVQVVKNLKPSQAIHLGHSMVIGNFGGITIGFDLSTQNGMIPAPFSNLALNSTKTFSHLLPLPEITNLIATAKEIAKYLDILVYSHLHGDHFSLNYVAEAIRTNPKIRIICPPNTKSYLEHTGQGKTTDSPNLILKPLINWLQKSYKDAIDEFLKDIEANANERKCIIDRIEEISLSSTITVSKGKQRITIKAFPTIHPAFQFYIRMPFEFSPPPPVVGYNVTYEDTSTQRCAIFIGEGASDAFTLSRVFHERYQLSIIFLQITEDTEINARKFIEEFMAHSCIMTLAIVERIVTEDTIIVPLHQGFWYYRLASGDIVKAREALNKYRGKKIRKLPFVDLTKKFIDIAKEKTYREIGAGYYSYLSNILKSIGKRWFFYKRLAQIAAVLPTNGSTQNLPLGTVIDFSISEKNRVQKPFSKETLQTLIQALVTEWQVMHQEIDRDWEWQDHFLYYILLTIGSVITLVNVFPNLELLFIVASFLLSLTGWTIIEKSIHMTSIGRFYLKELIPRANALVREMEDVDIHNPLSSKLKILLWEEFFRGRNIHVALQGLAGAGRFLMATIPGFASAMTFFFLKQNSGTNWSSLETILFSIASVMSLLPLASLFINARFAYSGE
jgi:hypothetical protein